MTGDPFAGFERLHIDGKDVWRAGTGPAVIVVHEMPGLHPGVVAFARRLVDAGFTAWLPSLFGRPGEPFSSGLPMLRSTLRACVSREFHVFALNRTSPVVGWLRSLAARAHAECGGPGVGTVGMCFTGGFALAMAVDPRVLAPVLSQPGLPASVGARRKAAIDLSPADLAAVRERTREDGLCALGLRFTQDRAVPEERFAMLRRELGDAFLAVEIDSSEGNRYGIPQNAHSVLTEAFVDEPGHPTRDALDRVLAFYRDRLQT
jgi:dienelactone hydrolase